MLSCLLELSSTLSVLHKMNTFSLKSQQWIPLPYFSSMWLQVGNWLWINIWRPDEIYYPCDEVTDGDELLPSRLCLGVIRWFNLRLSLSWILYMFWRVLLNSDNLTWNGIKNYSTIWNFILPVCITQIMLTLFSSGVTCHIIAISLYNYMPYQWHVNDIWLQDLISNHISHINLCWLDGRIAISMVAYFTQ